MPQDRDGECEERGQREARAEHEVHDVDTPIVHAETGGQDHHGRQRSEERHLDGEDATLHRSRHARLDERGDERTDGSPARSEDGTGDGHQRHGR